LNEDGEEKEFNRTPNSQLPIPNHEDHEVVEAHEEESIFFLRALRFLRVLRGFGVGKLEVGSDYNEASAFFTLS
jgi:hypothetical protein